ncbi:MAG TPA: TlpA disulfide reductase family protein [Isosphaeraceae bacterium]
MSLLTAALLAALALGDDTPAKSPADAPKAAASPATAERYRQIAAEYNAAMARAREARTTAATEAEGTKIYQELMPDPDAYRRRMIELAESAPQDPASRDAMLWILEVGSRDNGRYGDPFGQAIEFLVEHHSGDPEVARVALRLESPVSRHRDALFDAVHTFAEGREGKGMARLALAQYLEHKALVASMKRNLPKTFTRKRRDAQGKEFEMTGHNTNEEIAYDRGLRRLDPEALRREAERLYEEVVAEYADVPYVTRNHQVAEARLREHPPGTDTDPKERDRTLQAERFLARFAKTLGEVADDKLDAMHNVAVGKTAPEIDGVGLDGKPRKLADYRGKVVALVFWGSWCGPCMREVPYERELAERLKDKPFALLGVDCDEDRAAALRTIESERMAWPHWNDGAPGEGPIVKRYHIRGYPSVFVLDAKGVIRHKDLRGEALGKAVDALLKEMEPKPYGRRGPADHRPDPIDRGPAGRGRARDGRLAPALRPDAWAAPAKGSCRARHRPIRGPSGAGDGPDEGRGAGRFEPSPVPAVDHARGDPRRGHRPRMPGRRHPAARPGPPRDRRGECGTGAAPRRGAAFRRRRRPRRPAPRRQPRGRLQGPAVRPDRRPRAARSAAEHGLQRRPPPVHLGGLRARAGGL